MSRIGTQGMSGGRSVGGSVWKEAQRQAERKEFAQAKNIQNQKHYDEWAAQDHAFAETVGGEPTGKIETMNGQKSVELNRMEDAFFIQRMSNWDGKSPKPRLTKWLTPRQLKKL